MSVLVKAMQTQCRRLPDKVAVTSASRTWNYRQFDSLSGHVAAHLIARGVDVGDRVALHLLNGPELAVAYYACFKAGAVAVPIRTAHATHDVDYVLRHSGASVYIGQPELYGEVAPLRGSRGTVRLWCLTGAAPPDNGLLRFDELLTPPAHDPALPIVDSDAVAAILYTSGTTAQPKGVMHSHRTLLCWLAGPPPSSPEMVVVIVQSMMHVTALTTMIAALSLGGTVVPLPFDPAAVLDAIERHRPTLASGTPTMFHALVDQQAVRPREIDSVRMFSVGGDTMPLVLQERFTRVFGRPLHEGYGCTEVLPVPLVFNRPGALRSGALGRPADGVTVRLVDEAGADVVGGAGEIVVRSPGMTLGYWNDDGATAAAIRDGWFHTGDLARRDADGYLWFAGRTKEIIVRAGTNVSPQEVEEVLYEHPAVREAGVIGVPDLVLGEVITACIAVKEGMTLGPDELLAFARARLAGYKAPDRVLVFPDLPKSVSGKIHRRALLGMIPVTERRLMDV